MLEDNFVLMFYHFIFEGCHTNAIYSFRYHNYLFGYNNYLYIYYKFYQSQTDQYPKVKSTTWTVQIGAKTTS